MSVCIVTSDDGDKVVETARRLWRSAIYRTFRPGVFAAFCDERTLGNQTYVLNQFKSDFELLRATAERTILDLAQALDSKGDAYKAQHEFLVLVCSGMTSYGFEEVQTDQERVICQLTGKSIRAETAVTLRVWTPLEALPIKRRFSSVYSQAKKVLASKGDSVFIKYVDDNIDGIFSHSKTYFVSRKRLKFVRAVLLLSTIDMHIDTVAVRWVDAHDRDIDRAIDALDTSQEDIVAFVEEVRAAFKLIVTQTRKIESL